MRIIFAGQHCERKINHKQTYEKIRVQRQPVRRSQNGRFAILTRKTLIRHVEDSITQNDVDASSFETLLYAVTKLVRVCSIEEFVTAMNNGDGCARIIVFDFSGKFYHKELNQTDGDDLAENKTYQYPRRHHQR